MPETLASLFHWTAYIHDALHHCIPSSSLQTPPLLARAVGCLQMTFARVGGPLALVLLLPAWGPHCSGRQGGTVPSDGPWQGPIGIGVCSVIIIMGAELAQMSVICMRSWATNCAPEPLDMQGRGGAGAWHGQSAAAHCAVRLSLADCSPAQSETPSLMCRI